MVIIIILIIIMIIVNQHEFLVKYDLFESQDICLSLAFTNYQFQNPSKQSQLKYCWVLMHLRQV